MSKNIEKSCYTCENIRESGGDKVYCILEGKDDVDLDEGCDDYEKY
jgi:hypothetical protein